MKREIIEKQTEYREKLNNFLHLEEGWLVQANSKGEPVAEGGPITAPAYNVAEHFIQRTHELPDSLNLEIFPSVENGVLFEGLKDETYIVIEIEQNGNIVAVVFNTKQTESMLEEDSISLDDLIRRLNQLF